MSDYTSYTRAGTAGEQWDNRMNPHPDALVRMILKGQVPSEDRKSVKHKVLQHDTYISQANWVAMSVDDWVAMLTDDDNIYRISIFPDGVDVMCFGLASVDSNIDGHYDLTDDLPNWVKERLAVLMILSSTPPTSEVAGIGRRISSYVYWVYAPSAPETTS